MKVVKSIAQEQSAVATREIENRQFRSKHLPYFPKFYTPVPKLTPGFSFAMSSTNNIKSSGLLVLGRLSITFLGLFDYNGQGSLTTLKCLFSGRAVGKNCRAYKNPTSNYFCHEKIMIITDVE